MTAIDLDQRADTGPATSAWRARVPWIVAGTTIAALVATLATVLAVPAPIRPPAPPPPPPTAAPDPYVYDEASPGIGSPTQVWRDANGTMIGVQTMVRPYNKEDVWCRLAVDGQEVAATGVDGWPAVCTWVRGAVQR